MAKTKILTVSEALKSIEGKTNAKGEIVLNRFSKKNFNTLLLALANDVNFTSEVAKKAGDGVDVEKVLVTKEFRKWCKRLVESAGMDSKDAERVLEPTFVVPDVDGLYEFFADAIYQYMSAGNKFDFVPKSDFIGTISLKNVGKTKKTNVARNPQTKEILGTFELTKKAHKELKVKSNCPDWLSSRVKKG